MRTRRVILCGPTQRAHARALIDRASANSVVTIAPPSRTLAQNAKMWAMIADVQEAEPEGRMWSRETWKAAFMHALDHSVQFHQALDGSEFFPTGFRSSRLTVDQMSNLIETIYDYGTRHGVKWRATARAGFPPEDLGKTTAKKEVSEP